jgi:hypothetical protein
MLHATLPPADAIVTRRSIQVSSASSPLGVHEVIGLVNGPIHVPSYPSLPLNRSFSTGTLGFIVKGHALLQLRLESLHQCRV